MGIKMNLKVFYRISDKGRPKPKLSYATKINCLQNAIKEFGKDSFYVFADNCSNETISFLQEEKIAFEETSLGNAKSFQHMCAYIFAHCKDDDFVYLLEDDYIHLGGSKQKLLEGLAIADYVTLYDHPDKYKIYNKKTDEGNPFNLWTLQKTTLFASAHSHWRTVNSTTMTFAVKVATLKKDFFIFKKFTNTKDGIPNDFMPFVFLTQKNLLDAFKLFVCKKLATFYVVKNALLFKKVRTLICAVPASATHAETKELSLVVDWKI